MAVSVGHAPRAEDEDSLLVLWWGGAVDRFSGLGGGGGGGFGDGFVDGGHDDSRGCSKPTVSLVGISVQRVK